MNLNLSEKKAFVGGSTQGIGAATAHLLAELGATVVLLARNPDKLEAALKTLPTPKGQSHSYIAADFSHPGSLRSAVEKYFEAHPEPVHILVNNTGGPPGGPAHAADPEAYRTAFNQHLICNQILAQSVLEGMKAEGYGRIVNVISTSVKQPLHNLGVSNTIRGAVANWAKTLANELGGFGITVNNVLPGATTTGRLSSIIENKAKQKGISYEQAAEAMRGPIPAGRFGSPEEIANAIAFLASPAASYINGINLPVDGGRTGCL